MNSTSLLRTFVTGVISIFPTVAFADAYETADFSFGVFGGNANQSAPFQGVVAAYPAGSVYTGSLVFDQSLVPGPGTGLDTVFFSNFPAIAQIPAATALNLQLGALPAFTLATAVTPQFGSQEAGIEYNNGAFAGLFYISDFTYLGNPYELQIQGGSLSIVAIVNGNPTFQSLVNGYVNWGLTNEHPYTPPTSGVPEPMSLALFASGLLGAGLIRRRSAQRK